MKRILGIVGLLVLVSCADSPLRGPEGADGAVGPEGAPGGVLWRDATGRAVGYGDRLGVGYFDDAGRLWTVNPLTGQPDQPEVRDLVYETADCTGDAWDTTALALVPVVYQGGYAVRPVAARMALVNFGSYRNVETGECGEVTTARPPILATAFADFEVLDEVPADVVFSPPLYPVRPEPAR